MHTLLLILLLCSSTQTIVRASWDGSNIINLRARVANRTFQNSTCSAISTDTILPVPFSPLCGSQMPKLPSECQYQALKLRPVTFRPALDRWVAGPLHLFTSHLCGPPRAYA